MCGSGTILIEAALIAGSAAPGLFRDYYGFKAWKPHNEKLWERCLANARKDYEEGKSTIPPVRGYDNDDRAVTAARKNIMRAGLEKVIMIEKRNVFSLSDIDFRHVQQGLIAFNPPYGHRLADEKDLFRFYEQLGRMFSENFHGWKVAVLTVHERLAKSIGLRASKVNTLYNGSLKCTLAVFEINEKNRFVPLKRKK
jgi:23S rRNA (guanine2445-N2)-methyltransferase / 23S rRNA (guanine2069-N7)-methyltransferase